MGQPGGKVDESLWGKSRGLDPARPPYPLVRHLLDAAAMALFLWDRYLSENQRRAVAAGLGCGQDMERARGLAALCAGLHDIGKVSGFQLCSAHGRAGLSSELLGDMGRIGVERLSHDVAGMHASAAVLDVLGFPKGGDSTKAAMRRVAEIVGGHHGVFHQQVTWHPGNADLLGGVAWAEQRAAHAGVVFELLGSRLRRGRSRGPLRFW